MSASRGAPIPLEGWQVSTGISGSFQSESVATFAWNRWQVSTGISGNLRAEYAPPGATPGGATLRGPWVCGLPGGAPRVGPESSPLRHPEVTGSAPGARRHEALEDAGVLRRGPRGEDTWRRG